MTVSSRAFTYLALVNCLKATAEARHYKARGRRLDARGLGGIKLFDNPLEQKQEIRWNGLRRLLLLNIHR